ncbi:hypothetical protein V8C86DRAFT_3031853 [Haematococcus lacustris]
MAGGREGGGSAGGEQQWQQVEGGAGGEASAAAIQAAHKPQRPNRSGGPKAVWPLLPWMLVSRTRLDTRDLTLIASHRGLAALLELGLCRGQGTLAVRGSDLSPLTHPGTVRGGFSGSAASPHGSPGAAEPGAGAPAAPHSPSPGPLPPPQPAPQWPAREGPPGQLQPPQQQQAGGKAGGAGAAGGGRGGAGATPEGGAAEEDVRIKVAALINAAAAVQRLAVRRSHGSLHHAPPPSCALLLHCTEAGLEGEVACLMAAWLHWYQRLPLQEALLSAEGALGCPADPKLLELATAALLQAAIEDSNKVVLTWKYGGLSAAIAGDVVGDWSARLPLMRCKDPLGCKGNTARGNFYVEVSGLKPGVYFYKYIVDGTWTVDPASPKVLDSSGNWNNLLEIHERPPITTSRERLATARWQAARVAWATKMGLHGAA